MKVLRKHEQFLPSYGYFCNEFSPMEICAIEEKSFPILSNSSTNKCKLLSHEITEVIF